MAIKETLFERIDNYLGKRMNRIFWASFILTLLFSILLFDIRFSITGDDSSYVERSNDFIRHFIFPRFQGPLYPVILSPFILVFGIKAVPLKLLSLLFMLGFLYFLYRAYKDRIPAILLTALLFLLSVNSFVLYYSSQTYSEAFFMFLQAFTFTVFFAFFIDKEGTKPFGSLVKQHLILACCVLCLGVTRSIGFSAVIALSAYFIVKTQWKNLVFFLVSFALILVVFNGLKFLATGIPQISLTGEVHSLMSKDYYHPEMGQENFHGFLARLAMNSNWYISKGFYMILGFRELNDTGKLYPLLTVLTFILMFTSVILVYRKNSYLLFNGIYTLTVLLIIFLVAHTTWKQSRFIIPFFSFMVLMILSFLYYSLRFKRMTILQGFLPVLVLVILFSMIKTSIAQVKYTQQIDGKYYGLNPDLVNYCKVSEWASANLPPNTLVACRKPSISFIYGNGKKFFGISHMLAFSGDDLILNWQKKHLPYYIISSSSIRNNAVTKDLYFAFRNSIVGFGMNEVGNFYSPRFLILDFPDSIKGRVLRELTVSGITYTEYPDSLKNQLASSQEGISVIYPDSLLNFLIKAKVTHVLTDNIRVSADRKNDHVINMVEWFMNLIEFKYPRIRTKIIQIGSDDNEPASIYKLNYQEYGIKGAE